MSRWLSWASDRPHIRALPTNPRPKEYEEAPRGVLASGQWPDEPEAIDGYCRDMTPPLVTLCHTCATDSGRGQTESHRPDDQPNARRRPGSRVNGVHRGATRSALDAGGLRADRQEAGRRLVVAWAIGPSNQRGCSSWSYVGAHRAWPLSCVPAVKSVAARTARPRRPQRDLAPEARLSQ